MNNGTQDSVGRIHQGIASDTLRPHGGVHPVQPLSESEKQRLDTLCDTSRLIGPIQLARQNPVGAIELGLLADQQARSQRT